MKFLILLILLSACGNNDSYTTKHFNDTIIGGSISLDAAKTYSPNAWYDGQFIVDESRNYIIPSYLHVIYGNAGNHLARIRFGSVVCLYKGGASITRPLLTTNQFEIAKGQSYNYISCSDFSGPNTPIWVRSGQVIRVHILYGDRTVPTRIRAILGLR